MIANDRKLDVLLINPGGHRRIYQDLAKNLSAKESPIWVGLLAQFARRKGLSVKILDANAHDMSAVQVDHRLHDHKAKPDVEGLAVRHEVGNSSCRLNIRFLQNMSVLSK